MVKTKNREALRVCIKSILRSVQCLEVFYLHELHVCTALIKCGVTASHRLCSFPQFKHEAYLVRIKCLPATENHHHHYLCSQSVRALLCNVECCCCRAAFARAFLSSLALMPLAHNYTQNCSRRVHMLQEQAEEKGDKDGVHRFVWCMASCKAMHLCISSCHEIMGPLVASQQFLEEHRHAQCCITKGWDSVKPRTRAPRLPPSAVRRERPNTELGAKF